MQYNEGERLLLKGISGNYSRIITLIPKQNQNIDTLIYHLKKQINNNKTIKKYDYDREAANSTSVKLP